MISCGKHPSRNEFESSQMAANVCRSVDERDGESEIRKLQVVDENAFWIGYWGRHLKSSAYKYMHPYQKVSFSSSIDFQINHFPGAFHLGRKDRLSQHVERKRMAWGEDTFGLMPITYVLPADIAPMKAYLAESPEHHVIVKPVRPPLFLLSFE